MFSKKKYSNVQQKRNLVMFSKIKPVKRNLVKYSKMKSSNVQLTRNLVVFSKKKSRNVL